MNHEIKFRVWDGEMMHTVSELYFCQGGINWYGPGVGSGWCYLNPEFDWSKPKSSKPTKIDVLMQYTGHNDKNGTEIYEGDIYKIQCVGGTLIEQVKWDNDYAGFYRYDRRGNLCPGRTILPKDIVTHRVDCVEVIGNIHQHPELLEAKP